MRDIEKAAKMKIINGENKHTLMEYQIMSKFRTQSETNNYPGDKKIDGKMKRECENSRTRERDRVGMEASEHECEW